MAKRDRSSSKKIEKWINDGRRKGEGIDYKPWLTVRDVPSKDNLNNNLNIKIENTTAYCGDLKGIVERKFPTFNGKVKQKAPGAIQKEYRERGDQDYRLNATLNLKERLEYNL